MCLCWGNQVHSFYLHHGAAGHSSWAWPFRTPTQLDGVVHHHIPLEQNGGGHERVSLHTRTRELEVFRFYSDIKRGMDWDRGTGNFLHCLRKKMRCLKKEIGCVVFCNCIKVACQLNNKPNSVHVWLTVAVQLFLLLGLSLWSAAYLIPAVGSPELWAGINLSLSLFHRHTHSCVVCSDSNGWTEGWVLNEWDALNCRAWIFDCSAVKLHLGALNAILILFCAARRGSKCTV